MDKEIWWVLFLDLGTKTGWIGKMGHAGLWVDKPGRFRFRFLFFSLIKGWLFLETNVHPIHFWFLAFSLLINPFFFAWLTVPNWVGHAIGLVHRHLCDLFVSFGYWYVNFWILFSGKLFDCGLLDLFFWVVLESWYIWFWFSGFRGFGFRMFIFKFSWWTMSKVVLPPFRWLTEALEVTFSFLNSSLSWNDEFSDYEQFSSLSLLPLSSVARPRKMWIQVHNSWAVIV